MITAMLTAVPRCQLSTPNTMPTRYTDAGITACKKVRVDGHTIDALHLAIWWYKATHRGGFQVLLMWVGSYMWCRQLYVV
jgi:hypothetical protein